ncbi:MAG: hypothetical protein AAF198_02260 [Pseudomonadota bacterium]
MSKHGLIKRNFFAAFFVVCWLLGTLFFGLMQPNGALFAASGSLLTLAGFLLAVWCSRPRELEVISRALTSNTGFGSAMYDRTSENLRRLADWKSGEIDDLSFYYPSGAKNAAEAAIIELDRNASQLKKVGLFEISFVVSGTIQWGFGDAIV